MKVNVTVEITTDAELKERAVAVAQSVVNTVIAKVQGTKLRVPGGMVSGCEEVELPTPTRNAPIQAKAAEEMALRCPECGGLYGAHRESCGYNGPLPSFAEMSRVIKSKEKELAELSHRYDLRIGELSEQKKEITKLSVGIMERETKLNRYKEDRVAFARRFAEWLDEQEDAGITDENPAWKAYQRTRADEQAFVNILLPAFLNTLPNAS